MRDLFVHCLLVALLAVGISASFDVMAVDSCSFVVSKLFLLSYFQRR
jgi:hypothetical protein